MSVFAKNNTFNNFTTTTTRKKKHRPPNVTQKLWSMESVKCRNV